MSQSTLQRPILALSVLALSEDRSVAFQKLSRGCSTQNDDGAINVFGEHTQRHFRRIVQQWRVFVNGSVHTSLPSP